MLVEPATHGVCFLGPQVQGLALLAPVEFPETLFLSLVNDGENAVNGFANNSDLRKFGKLRRPSVPLAPCNWDSPTFASFRCSSSFSSLWQGSPAFNLDLSLIHI